MDGVYGASRAVLQLIAGIAGGCASWHPKIASSLGNCCSVGVTTAAGRVAGGVFIVASSLGAPRAHEATSKLGKQNFEVARDPRRPHVYAPSGVPRPLFGARDGLSG